MKILSAKIWPWLIDTWTSFGTKREKLGSIRGTYVWIIL